MGIKHIHLAVTVLLALTLGGAGLERYLTSDTRVAADSRLVAEWRLADDLHLYVTEWQGGNATTSSVYRSYLTSGTDGTAGADLVKALSRQDPVLMADNQEASVRMEGGRVVLALSGRVYRFRNVVYMDNGPGQLPRKLELTARFDTRDTPNPD
ncbi:hypothetical protein [Cupriavidus pauculus]|uniref:hypothetical protein n=1 Tax=Cupriavidus pauculus TaxID=82633 RepID=UPI001EE394DB|nr:hypothetical protein [Cupriavidus pauculus]GJG96254.1 hypothetical protein CBA19C6_17215 [Cupriavidus pauculus]